MNPISWSDFFILLAGTAGCMLMCRVVPLFVLKNKELPTSVNEALSYIPPAAFAALVANDLIKPDMFAAGIWPAAAPLLAAVVVALVGVKTKSLMWCALSGVISYALLSML